MGVLSRAGELGSCNFSLGRGHCRGGGGVAALLLLDVYDNTDRHSLSFSGSGHNGMLPIEL